MVAAVATAVPGVASALGRAGAGRFAGSLLRGLKGVMPTTPGEAFLSFAPDLFFAGVAAANAPGAQPEIGYEGTSPLTRAGIFGYEALINGLFPSLGGRFVGDKLFGQKGAFIGEMAAQTVVPFAIENPIAGGEWARFGRAQQAAQEASLRRQIEREVSQRGKGETSGTGSTAAYGIPAYQASSGVSGMDNTEFRRTLESIYGYPFGAGLG